VRASLTEHPHNGGTAGLMRVGCGVWGGGEPGRHGELLTSTAALLRLQDVWRSKGSGVRAQADALPALPTGTVPVEAFSPWLAAYRGGTGTGAGAGADAVEVPGQYTCRARPHPASHARVVGVDATCLVLRSLRRPKRLTLHGSDGNDHRFLVKVRVPLLLCAYVRLLQTHCLCAFWCT
jgi:hypothetical protein